jgi:sulfate transport system substrate-binding protein
VPTRTVEIELPVAIARKFSDARKTTQLARAYLEGLYDPEVQALFAKHHFRPRSPSVAAKTTGAFPKLTLVKSEEFFGPREQRSHLAEGGVFDNLAAAR